MILLDDIEFYHDTVISISWLSHFMIPLDDIKSSYDTVISYNMVKSYHFSYIMI